MKDTTLELTGTPIQQLTLDWENDSTETIAVGFQQTFTQASIFPNQVILRELRQLSESMGIQLPLALMAVNDTWSVYAVGPRWFAVHTDVGEVVAFSYLAPEDIDRMGIPWPE